MIYLITFRSQRNFMFLCNTASQEKPTIQGADVVYDRCSPVIKHGCDCSWLISISTLWGWPPAINSEGFSIRCYILSSLYMRISFRTLLGSSAAKLQAAPIRKTIYEATVHINLKYQKSIQCLENGHRNSVFLMENGDVPYFFVNVYQRV